MAGVAAPRAAAPRAGAAVAARAAALLALTVVLAARPGAGAAPAALPTDEEAPGEGFVLPGGLWMAGDLSAEVHVPETGPADATLGDLGLLARWEATARLSLFGELRVEDFVRPEEGAGVRLGDGEVALERAYVEALPTPSLVVRLGRVFTPFGLWNVIRRAPLTWTVERPAATEGMFPEHATGLSLAHQTTWEGWTIDASAYGPVQDEPELQHSDESGWLVGSRLAAGRDLGAGFGGVGVSVAEFRPHDLAAWTTAAGLDLEFTTEGHQLTGELVYRVPPRGGRAIYGLYLQDVVPLSPLVAFADRLYGVLRVELFQPGQGQADVGPLVGVLWRPLPRLVLRADYLFGTRTLARFEPGFVGSVALLL